MSLPLIKMQVFRYTHGNGESKVWCIAQTTVSDIETRWGASGASLQSKTRAGDMQSMIRKKKSEGYKLEGEYFVSDRLEGLAGTASQPNTPPPVAAAPASTPVVTGLFHWQADGLSAGWADVLADLAQKAPGGDVKVTAQGASKATVVADDIAFDVSQRNGKARGSILEGKGSWKVALLLFGLGRHFTVQVVDDANEFVSVRSLKRQTKLGFTENEFDDFAEQMGLIDRTVVMDPVFATFI